MSKYIIKESADLKKVKNYGYKKVAEPFFDDYFKKVDNNHFVSISQRGKKYNQVSKIALFKGKLYEGIEMYAHCGEAEEIEMDPKYIQDLIIVGLAEEVQEEEKCQN